MCMTEGTEFSNFLKHHVASKIISYFCLIRKRKIDDDATWSDRRRSPAFVHCRDLLTNGTPPAHILQEDPEPRHFKDMLDVWAWTMNRILHCINHARDNIEYTDYEVIHEFPKIAATHDSGRPETYATLFRIISAINMQLERVKSVKNEFRTWSLQHPDMAWLVKECDQYEQSESCLLKLSSYTDCQTEHD